jgi:hypothetical protein
MTREYETVAELWSSFSTIANVHEGEGSTPDAHDGQGGQAVISERGRR